MKKSVLVFAIVAILATAIVNVNAATKPEKGLLIGTIVDLTTLAMTGDIEGNLETAKNRAEHGFPVALIEDETGTVWILVYRNSAPASHLQVANKFVQEYMGMQVVMQGLKYKSNGVNAIRFTTISEY
ncbi:MAG TPA: hypothetical protein EYN96_09185 [Candidatus Hydrogenedentes bacterium]|nr:hypothetical protein [Candidatus Hydrogenedentota bacterium]